MHINKGKLEFITVLYGLAVLLVLFGHSHPLHIEYPFLMQEVTSFVYEFHMPLFFFIAGILVAYTADGRNIWKWWKRKATKLLIPYTVLTLIAWIPKYILGSYMTDNMEISFSNFIRILFIPREGIGGHFWFIPTYLVVTLLCAYLYKIVVYTPKIVWGGVLLIGAVLTLFPIPIGWFAIEDISKELVYALLGMFLCKYIIKKKGSICRWFTGAVALMMSVTLYVCDIGIIGNKLISLLMIYVMLTLSVVLSNQYKLKAVKYIGTHAFTIFIYSWPIQAVVEMLLTVVLSSSWQMIYTCMFVSGLCGPLFIYEFYCRFIHKNRFFDVMLGVKK